MYYQLNKLPCPASQSHQEVHEVCCVAAVILLSVSGRNVCVLLLNDVIFLQHVLYHVESDSKNYYIVGEKGFHTFRHLLVISYDT